MKQRNGSFDEFAAFIRQGLMLDCPVAFLNLSNGSLNNLDSWHWVAITKLQAGQDADLLATIADSGERKVINLSEWYRSSWLGGAAVWFSVDLESSPEANPDRE
jgi:hypothetical protein